MYQSLFRWPIKCRIVADIDSDGDMDILAAYQAGKTFAWFENDGNADPTWAAENISTSTNYAIGISAADMNGDGVMDVVSHDKTFIGMRMVEQGLLLRIGQFHLVYQKV